MKVKQKKLTRQWNKTKTKQVINSNHKTFNKYTNILDNKGTMIANTQDLYIFDYSKNKKQEDLIEWLLNYLFEIVED